MSLEEPEETNLNYDKTNYDGDGEGLENVEEETEKEQGNSNVYINEGKNYSKKAENNNLSKAEKAANKIKMVEGLEESFGEPIVIEQSYNQGDIQLGKKEDEEKVEK